MQVRLYANATKLSILISSIAKGIIFALANTNTIVLGDTNIALTKKEAIAALASTKGIVVEPSTNSVGIPEPARTLDCFLTNIPTTYHFKESCKNFAIASMEVKKFDATMFAGCWHNRSW